MGRGNRLLRIHRFGGRVQLTREPVSAAFDRNLFVRSILPRESGEASCKKKTLRSRLLRRSLFLTTPFHRTPNFSWV